MSDLLAVRFVLTADALPGLLPRLLQPLAKRDLVADSFHAVRQGDAMQVGLVLEAMPAGMVHLVAGNVGQVVGVWSVETVLPPALRAAA